MAAPGTHWQLPCLTCPHYAADLWENMWENKASLVSSCCGYALDGAVYSLPFTCCQRLFSTQASVEHHRLFKCLFPVLPRQPSLSLRDETCSAHINSRTQAGPHPLNSEAGHLPGEPYFRYWVDFQVLNSPSSAALLERAFLTCVCFRVCLCSAHACGCEHGCMYKDDINNMQMHVGRL